ncbi:uncharacterized protein [Anabrus simplex]|uniref:uncharacterized protein n=1 Tax=Anabrus simplex TaxID=316456 RepID=UPI0035A2A2D9
MLLILLLLFCALTPEALDNPCLEDLKVVDAGYGDIRRNDVGIVFYLTVKNNGLHPYHVITKMDECCETHEKDNTDCSYMQLIGGDMGLIYPQDVRNLTLIYPNLYTYNRHGECVISVWYKGNNVSGSLRHRIMFNTMISCREQPPHMQQFYDLSEVTTCPSLDMDPLDKCEPVNCHMKYDGYRNYYNSKLRICQPVPICIANPNKELPDVAYVPTSNTCRNLESDITDDDVKFLTRGTFDNQEWHSEPTPRLAQNIRCHHGKVDNTTGFCICDEGWTSAPMDRDQLEPGTQLYHMCTVQMRQWSSALSMRHVHSRPLFLFLAALSAALLLLLCALLLYVFLCWIYKPKYSASCGASSSRYGSTETICLCSENDYLSDTGSEGSRGSRGSRCSRGSRGSRGSRRSKDSRGSRRSRDSQGSGCSRGSRGSGRSSGGSESDYDTKCHAKRS